MPGANWTELSWRKIASKRRLALGAAALGALALAVAAWASLSGEAPRAPATQPGFDITAGGVFTADMAQHAYDAGGLGLGDMAEAGGSLLVAELMAAAGGGAVRNVTTLAAGDPISGAPSFDTVVLLDGRIADDLTTNQHAGFDVTLGATEDDGARSSAGTPAARAALRMPRAGPGGP